MGRRKSFNDLVKSQVITTDSTPKTLEAQEKGKQFLSEKGLNPRQQLFVHEYLVDMDAAAAYQRAGYEPKTETSAVQGAYQLLRHPGVMAALEEAQRERITRIKLTGDWAVQGFLVLYLKAQADKDWSAACKALENIGKFLGIYEAHNKQKVYTESDAIKLRQELEAAGFDWTRQNLKPSSN